MRTFHPHYHDRTGGVKKTKRWYVEIRDQHGRARRLPAFSDRAASAEYGRKLEKVAAIIASGEGPTLELGRWLDSLPADKRKALARIGLVDPRRLAAGKPLADHVEDFKASLQASERCTEHVSGLISRIERLCESCGFAFIADIEPLRVESQLRAMREQGKKPISSKTSNAFLGAIRQFTRWLVQNDRLREDPLRRLKRLRPDRRYSRRALTEIEVSALLTTTTAGPDRSGLSGPDRALIYRLALETGLRAKEIASLRVGSFDLQPDRASVTLEAAYSKRRRKDVMPLRAALANALRDHLALRMPATSAFAIPPNWRQAEMLSADLVAAKVALIDVEGCHADFHALRHTFITNLSRAGVNPKIAQSLARHSSIVLTMDHYTHLRVDDDRRALEMLPSTDCPRPRSAPATGTE